MRYWQMRAARLSTASQKLEADGQWHAMTGTPHAWYRVGKGRIVQRVNFDGSAEEQRLLSLISTVEPLPEMATVTGFREEIRIALEGDATYVILPLGYAPAALEDLRLTLDEYGIELRPDESLLYAYVPISTVDRDELIHSQRVLSGVRLFFQAIGLATTSSAIKAAKSAFHAAMKSAASD